MERHSSADERIAAIGLHAGCGRRLDICPTAAKRRYPEISRCWRSISACCTAIDDPIERGVEQQRRGKGPTPDQELAHQRIVDANGRR